MKKRFRDWTYRLSIDDNVVFLEDLAKGGYGSLFEQSYTAFWKEMHERYGAKIQFNIHGKSASGFSLRQLPEAYKSEWIENSDWLRLTFHQMEDPKSRFSYNDSTYEEAKRDYLEVTKEIVRFAGRELISPFTTIHHAAGTKEVCRAWKDCGVRGLGAGTWVRADGNVVHGYYLDDAQVAELFKRGMLKDDELGLYFFKFDVILHRRTLSPEGLVQVAESVLGVPEHWHHIEVTYEEWAFDPCDRRALPDARERVEAVLSFMTSSGIRPVFLEELLIESGGISNV